MQESLYFWLEREVDGFLIEGFHHVWPTQNDSEVEGTCSAQVRYIDGTVLEWTACPILNTLRPEQNVLQMRFSNTFSWMKVTSRHLKQWYPRSVIPYGTTSRGFSEVTHWKNWSTSSGHYNSGYCPSILSSDTSVPVDEISGCQIFKGVIDWISGYQFSITSNGWQDEISSSENAYLLFIKTVHWAEKSWENHKWTNWPLGELSEILDE